MAEEKKFNIQESRIFSVKRDDEQVIKFPIDTKWVEQIDTLPFFIVEKESGGYDLLELTDDNQLFGVLLNCNKILLPSELTEDNKYLLAYQKNGEENIRLWSMEKRCELLEKIEMSAIYLEKALNGFIPISTTPFSKNNTRLVEIETGEEIYGTEITKYRYLVRTDTEFYEIKDRADCLCGLINTKTRMVLEHLGAIAFFASKDYLFVCGKHEQLIYSRHNFRFLIGLFTDHFDKSTIKNVCHTAWDNNVFVHYMTYQGKPITNITMVFAHSWGNVFCQFAYNQEGEILRPIEFERDLNSEDFIDPASLSKDMNILSKALKSKEYLKW